MRFWRICRLRYAAQAASGEGSRLYGGRWNRPGLRVVYASSSLALAAMETFVNLEPNLKPLDLVSVSGDIPDSLPLARLDEDQLPKNWHRSRNESLRQFGDRWIESNTTVGLLVPSAAVRGEWNILLNPQHSSFGAIRLDDPFPFNFDVRMYR